MSLLVRNGIVLTMNVRFDAIEGDVSIRDGLVAAVGSNLPGSHDKTIDARGGYILPGFIQTHVHLCQTLFRGYAEELRWMDSLRTRVGPMEAADTASPLRMAARPAAPELI